MGRKGGHDNLRNKDFNAGAKQLISELQLLVIDKQLQVKAGRFRACMQTHASMHACASCVHFCMQLANPPCDTYTSFLPMNIPHSLQSAIPHSRTNLTKRSTSIQVETLSEEHRQLRARALAAQTALQHCEAVLRLTTLLNADMLPGQGGCPCPPRGSPPTTQQQLQEVQQQWTSSLHLEGLPDGVPSSSDYEPLPLGWEPEAAAEAFEGYDHSIRGIRDSFLQYISAAAPLLW